MATLPKKAAPAAKKPAPATKKAPAKKTAGAAKRPRPAPITFEAPSDFKPAFFEVQFAVGEDGLMVPASFGAKRVRGRWDNAEAKRYDMAEYDPVTLLGIATRFAYITFAPNVAKRLPAGSKFQLVLRVAKKAADGTLTARVVAARYVNDAGKWKWYTDKADPIYRKLRRAAKVLPSAFVAVQLPPSGRRTKKSDEDSGED